VNNAFPPGTAQGTSLPPDQRLGFLLLILPYLESTPVYSQMALAEPWDSPTNTRVLAAWTGGRINQCPDWTTHRWRPSGSQLDPTRGHLAHTNYVGVAGVGADAAGISDDDPRAGIFGHDRKRKVEDVKDGLANTLLLLETARDVGPWPRGGSSTVRGVDTSDAPPVGDGRPFGGMHFSDSRFSSKTPRGGHAVLADGSVRKLSDGTAADVLGKLATAAGGEEVPAGW
jgi:hypothetical protein